MTITAPTKDGVRILARELGLDLSDDDVEFFHELLGGGIPAAYGPLDAEPDYLPEVKYPRTPGYRPSQAEDPLQAWYYKTNIKGAPRGKLHGKRIALKDNVCLAGVPMMCGASTMEGYVPDIDATIVTRILDAGGEIAGKTNCEYFCFSGSSHTNSIATTQNPYQHGVTAGGSSSGSAAVVASGDVEMAIGGDQAGSIRNPASFCGLYGMKATWGLVPYTGVFPVDITLDHTGPMTATTADNALLLEVIAGEDGLDPRQFAPQVAPYCTALGQGVEGMRIGIVKEGFGHPHSDPAVDAKVRAAAAKFSDLGATVAEISVPMHRLGYHIWVPIGVDGTIEMMMRGDGYGTNWRGLYVSSLMAWHHNWRERSGEFPDGLKLGMLMGHHVHSAYGGRYYAKAQNLARKLRAAYDAAFDSCDLVVMPTVPVRPRRLPDADATRLERMAPGLDNITNACVFNVTGHPSISVPCGMAEGLPIGMMLTGRYWDEAALYRASDAFEQAYDWRNL
ncbi:MAG: amidase [Proteobacteria bacterium]|nr:amidase [Pseudomonadota bacterium]